MLFALNVKLQCYRCNIIICSSNYIVYEVKQIMELSDSVNTKTAKLCVRRGRVYPSLWGNKIMILFTDKG